MEPLSFLSVFGEPGLPWQQEMGTGTWTLLLPPDVFCVLNINITGGGGMLANVSDSASSIELSTPNDPNVQAAGVLRRAEP